MDTPVIIITVLWYSCITARVAEAAGSDHLQGVLDNVDIDSGYQRQGDGGGGEDSELP